MNLKLFILTTFAAMAACSPSSVGKRACPFPAWFVESITATYSDDTYTPGLATFSLTHVLTNAKETVQCPLQFNSVCRLDSGTALDPALQIHFQVNMDIGWVTFNKTWECPGQSIPGRPWFAVGYAEFVMVCPAEITSTMTCTSLSNDVLLVNTSVGTPDFEPAGGE